MHDLSVLYGDNRDESVVIGCATGKNFPVHYVLEDDDTTILSSMDNKCIARMEFDLPAISRKARHQLGSASNRRGPARKVVSRFEDSVVGELIEIVLAINQPVQTFQDDFEEWIQCFKDFICVFFHNE